MSTQRQIPGGAFLNETTSDEHQIPGGVFVNQTEVAAATIPTLSAPGVTDITATSARPQVTLTY